MVNFFVNQIEQENIEIWQVPAMWREKVQEEIDRKKEGGKSSLAG